MADNVVANSIPVATRSVTYSGDASQNAQVVGAVLLTGSDDAKVATDAIPATAGLDSTGGGIPAIALVAQFDDASTTTVTENQFAHPRLSSRRALLVEGVASGTAIPVSAASLPLPSGAATETTLGGVLTTSDFDTKAGSLTETAPASDTASSGLNGRLQRIAQRLTSLITALGSPFQAGGSIGNTTFASTQSGTWTVQPGNTANTTAWKVDGSAVTQPVSGTVTTTQGTSATSTQTSVVSNASSVSLLASNGSRKLATIFNDSTAVLYVFFGASAATVTNFTVQLAAGAYYELPHPVYTGELRGIWSAANGNARVTELT